MWFCRLDRRAEDLTLPWSAWGINVDDCRIPDNEGNQIVDEPVAPDGPAAYFVTVPIKAMVQRIQDRNIPASVSNTAGTLSVIM